MLLAEVLLFVCMCVYVALCECACGCVHILCVCVCACLRVRFSVCVFIYIFLREHAWLRVRVHVPMHVCMCVLACECACQRVYMVACMHACVWMPVYERVHHCCLCNAAVGLTPGVQALEFPEERTSLSSLTTPKNSISLGCKWACYIKSHQLMQRESTSSLSGLHFPWYANKQTHKQTPASTHLWRW